MSQNITQSWNVYLTFWNSLLWFWISNIIQKLSVLLPLLLFTKPIISWQLVSTIKCDIVASLANFSLHSITSVSSYVASFHSCDVFTNAVIILLLKSLRNTANPTCCFCLLIIASALILKAFLDSGCHFFLNSSSLFVMYVCLVSLTF